MRTVPHRQYNPTRAPPNVPRLQRIFVSIAMSCRWKRNVGEQRGAGTLQMQQESLLVLHRHALHRPQVVEGRAAAVIRVEGMLEDIFHLEHS